MTAKAMRRYASYTFANHCACCRELISIWGATKRLADPVMKDDRVRIPKGRHRFHLACWEKLQREILGWDGNRTGV
jgi:hypothetical protein